MSVRSTGRKSAIGASAVALIGSSTPFSYQVQVVAANGNGSGLVYIGLSTVMANAADTTDGYELAAGQTVTIPAAFCGGDLANLFAIGSTTGLKVFFIYY
jgi:hypothetical protein